MKRNSFRWIALLVFWLGVAAPSGVPFADTTGSSASAERASIEAAVADPTRAQSDRARDENRKPAEILEFAGVRAGQKVADLGAGTGYYTHLLSRIVGAEGRVYAMNPDFLVARRPQSDELLQERITTLPLDNVTHMVTRFDELSFPEPLDAIMMVLFYHDTIWAVVDREAMNQQIFRALKPGGIFLLIDHHAIEGADESVAKSLHRGDAAAIKAEVSSAGFEFDAESGVLAHPDDPRSENVFGPIRGMTDRFVYRFKKPE